MEAAIEDNKKKMCPELEMITATQLEVLEKTYAEAAFPSVSVRAELSEKLWLTAGQLRLWFFYRRLKDRDVSPTMWPLSIREARSMAFAEAEMGEPLREDGPILGTGYPDLPPDAFDSSRPILGPQEQAGQPFRGIVYQQYDAKSIKTQSLLPNMEHCFIPISNETHKLTTGNVHVVYPHSAATALQEYEFLPDQPHVGSVPCKRVAPSHCYDSPIDGPTGRASLLSTAWPFFQSHVSGVNLLSQQGRQGHIYSSPSGEYDCVSHKNSFVNIVMGAQFGSHPIIGVENSFVSSDRRVSHEDVSRVERKCKSEEARIEREVEAHEKQIQELEKQDIMRQKREEQMRKEMERHERERQKEEERLMREKQREEGRLLREKMREKERQERFLRKETLRAEKMRQKEELRMEKEEARLKAANERASARRIARESMELIEDERLELMVLAALTKGLPSIVSLDSDTLLNLESFRGMLSRFPPISVQLKRPFAIQPWLDSEEKIGSLLMVWRFLITFADVLELWPFTLDEFVQAFHDYDPRLLGEIHVALLRIIIKDFEDVARVPSIELGANQNSAANPRGGHPQIVKGAYARGFNRYNWKKLLNPLTWPEILRQFALSAGFGPQLKKKSIGPPNFCDDNEGLDGEDRVSTLCNGAAAENAFTRMQEKGFSYPCKSRHRLTPGIGNNSGATVDQLIDVTGNCITASNPGQEAAEIDENNYGEQWVQGLMEGEYSDLSVDDRLNALVALIGVANEGNSIRVILEERFEAANALKKQMWAQAQVDKRRMKEESVMKLQYSFTGINGELNLTSSAVEGGQSPLLDVDKKSNEAFLNPTVKAHPFLDPQNDQNYLNNFPTERNMVGQVLSTGSDNFSLQQLGYATEKSRSQLKSSISHRAEEMYVYRSLPLGQDRRCNRYWQFVTSASRNDPGSGRIFFESHDGYWRVIDSKEAFDALLASLDTRGIRESHLHFMLRKIETSFKETVRRNFHHTKIAEPRGVTIGTDAVEMNSSLNCTARIDSPSRMVCGSLSDTSEQASSFKIELGRNDAEKIEFLKRYLDFQKWMWKECFDPSIVCAMKYGKKRCMQLLGICDLCYDSYLAEDNHCPSCHRTFGILSNNFSFSEHVVQCEEEQKVKPNWNFHGSNSSLPMRIRLLKAMLSLIEVSVPSEALQPFWTEDCRKSWGVKLQTSSSAKDLLQMLTMLKHAIKQGYQPSNFETTKELLASSTLSECALDDISSLPDSVAILPWIPQTTAAVALRLMEIDASISYMFHQKVESQEDNESGEFIKLQSRYTLLQNIQEVEPDESTEQAGYLQEENWVDPGRVRSSSGRGRGGRGRGRGRSRGGRGQRGGGSRSESAKENAGNSENMGEALRRKSQTRGQGCKRGRPTVSSCQRTKKRVIEKQIGLSTFEDTVNLRNNSAGKLPRSSGGGKWDIEETTGMRLKRMDNSNSVEALKSDDIGQATGNEYDDQEAYGKILNGKSEDSIEESKEDGNGNGDEEGDRDGDEEREEDGDGDSGGYED